MLSTAGRPQLLMDPTACTAAFTEEEIRARKAAWNRRRYWRNKDTINEERKKKRAARTSEERKEGNSKRRAPGALPKKLD